MLIASFSCYFIPMCYFVSFPLLSTEPTSWPSLTSSPPPLTPGYPHTLTTHTLHIHTTLHPHTSPHTLTTAENFGYLRQPLDQAECTSSSRVCVSTPHKSHTHTHSLLHTCQDTYSDCECTSTPGDDSSPPIYTPHNSRGPSYTVTLWSTCVQVSHTHTHHTHSIPPTYTLTGALHSSIFYYVW